MSIVFHVAALIGFLWVLWDAVVWRRQRQLIRSILYQGTQRYRKLLLGPFLHDICAILSIDLERQVKYPSTETLLPVDCASFAQNLMRAGPVRVILREEGSAHPNGRLSLILRSPAEVADRSEPVADLAAALCQALGGKVDVRFETLEGA